MGSTFKGIDYFGSGPHRFASGRRGRRLVALSTLSGVVTDAGSLEFGDLEIRVEVRGRLRAASDAALWVIRDAITAEGDSTVGSGVLVDHHGQSWSTMKLLSYEEDGPTDRGREVSVGYTALFGQLVSG
jgi:hypothetical protein